ncbi:MAG: integrase, partial [Desulfurococcaceae archaeon]
AMGVVVKRVKGKLYVYEQYRTPQGVFTKYIGPLEELVRIYQIYRVEGQVNYRLGKRDLQRITRRLAEEVVNFLRERGCGGWDLNPRRPTPSGPEPHTLLTQASGFPRGVNYNHETGVQDNQVVEKFTKWCLDKGTSLETCKQYAAYLMKPLDLSNKWSRLAWKAYFKFMNREDLWGEIKTKRSGVDLYVPSDEEVKKALEEACRSSEPLCWVYKLLIYSGLRLSEVCKLLREQEDGKWINGNGFWKYPLAWKRGSKQVFYCYTLEKPPRLSISEKWVSNWAAKNNVLNPKYIRKWFSTKMLQLGVSEEVVNFIQGRIPQSILAKHYLKFSVLADEAYKIFAASVINLINSVQNFEHKSL